MGSLADWATNSAALGHIPQPGSVRSRNGSGGARVRTLLARGCLSTHRPVDNPCNREEEKTQLVCGCCARCWGCGLKNRSLVSWLVSDPQVGQCNATIAVTLRTPQQVARSPHYFPIYGWIDGLRSHCLPLPGHVTPTPLHPLFRWPISTTTATAGTSPEIMSTPYSHVDPNFPRGGLVGSPLSG